MDKKEANIIVEITSQCGDVELDLDRIKELAVQTWLRFSVDRSNIEIAIAGDEQIEKINQQFLSHSGSTDVISFDLSDDTEQGKTIELVVNIQQARRESEKRTHSAEAELALYVVHGLLHQLGFDDTDDEQAEKMHKAEDEILQSTGFGIVYGE